MPVSHRHLPLGRAWPRAAQRQATRAGRHWAAGVSEATRAGVGGGVLFTADAEGGARRVGPVLGRFVMPVRHRPLRWGRGGPRAARRPHIYVIPVRMPLFL